MRFFLFCYKKEGEKIRYFPFFFSILLFHYYIYSFIMHIINTTPVAKSMLSNKFITSRSNKAFSTTASTRRRSSASSHGSYGKKKIIRPDSPKEEKDEPIFNIVYSAHNDNTMMITPPPSPKSSPSSACFEANDRILTAKRNGQLKTVMNEYIALQKEGLLFTDHTYNLILDSYASLRSNGTPLTPMMKSKYLFICLFTRKKKVCVILILSLF